MWVVKLIPALAGLVVMFATAASAQSRDVLADRQRSLNWTLTDDPLDLVVRARASCASGKEHLSVAMRRRAGFIEAPDAADYCVTLLTRLGRAGQLGYVRDARRTTPTAALAFDNGFVAAYLRAGPLPSGLPTMDSLKPVAERCLAMREPDTELCQSVGYAYGARAALGEVVVVR